MAQPELCGRIAAATAPTRQGQDGHDCHGTDGESDVTLQAGRATHSL